MTTHTHMTRRSLFATGTAAIALSGAPALASRVDQGPKELALQNITLAGRQRMLGQRIARAAFYTALGVDTDVHLRMMRKSRNQFENTQLRLRKVQQSIGSTGAGQDILSRLDVVDILWSEFDTTVTEISQNHTVSDTNVETLANTNLALLAASDDLLKAILGSNALTESDTGLSMSLDLADRQRMLSQKMAKETAMIALGVVPELVQVSLAKNAQLFSASLRALVDGSPTIGLPPAPGQVRAKLHDVGDIWADYNRVVGFIADQGFASAFELGAVATLDDPLLVTMNDAISLYRES